MGIIERNKKPKYPNILDVIKGFTPPTFSEFINNLRKALIVISMSVLVIFPAMDLIIAVIKRIFWFAFA